METITTLTAWLLDPHYADIIPSLYQSTFLSVFTVRSIKKKIITHEYRNLEINNMYALSMLWDTLEGVEEWGIHFKRQHVETDLHLFIRHSIPEGRLVHRL